MLRSFFVILGFICGTCLRADVAVLTQHNDLARTGANLSETVLNVANVNSNSFGLLYSRVVDDQVYAQPLIVTNVSVPGSGMHNLLIVATVSNSVYAFDADDSAVAAPYWKVSFLTSTNVVPVNNSDLVAAGNPCGTRYANINGSIGIVGTPVVDPVSGTLYCVARTKEYGTNFVQSLHALDVTTGAERAFSPVVIAATIPGTGDGSVSNLLSFDPLQQNQRASLALVNGFVYIGWGSHCDFDPYHGWFMGYNASNLVQTFVFNTTPNGSEGAIWMSGQAPSADSDGNIYISVANGTVDTGADPYALTNRSQSFLRLTPSGTNLTVTSSFTPFDFNFLNTQDWDLGSAGLLLIPNSELAFSGGKQGALYLVNRTNMGGLSLANYDTNVLQTIWIDDGVNDKLYGSPIWWDGPTNSYTYLWAGFNDYLRQYPFDRIQQQFLTNSVITSPTLGTAFHPGGILSLSANGTNAGTGIVWASHPTDPVADAEHTVVSGILRAYNAENVHAELWNSDQVHARDAVPTFAKFVPPTIANGKVYVATFSGQVNVYGLLPLPRLSAAVSGTNLVLFWPTNFASFHLQTNSAILAGDWGSVTNAVRISGTNYQVTFRPTGSSTYFRLKR